MVRMETYILNLSLLLSHDDPNTSNNTLPLMKTTSIPSNTSLLDL